MSERFASGTLTNAAQVYPVAVDWPWPPTRQQKAGMEFGRDIANRIDTEQISTTTNPH